MAQIIIPKEQAESPVGDGGDTPFPKGQWCGTIDEVRIRELPPWADTPGRGYKDEDGEVLSIQFGSNEALEGQDDIGARKHFVDFVIRDGLETPATVEMDPKKDCDSWMLQRGTRLLSNLGAALGETEELEDEDGKAMLAVAEDFLDNLRAGAFDGTSVAFRIGHRGWSKNGKSGTEVITREFFQAV